MANYTSNYNLTKPIATELYDIEVQNGNMDTIDSNLKSVSDKANSADARSQENSTNINKITNYEARPFELTGNPVQIDNYEGMPLNVITTLEPVQSGSGDPSPANIRSISGWTGATMTRCGKNLLNYNQWRQSTVANGTAVFENNGVTLTATGDDCFTQYDGDTVKIYIAEGETITLSWQESENKPGHIYIFPNGDLPGVVGVSNVSAKEITYTAGAGVSYVTFRFGVSNKGDTISYKNIMIEYGSTATAYEPYQSNTYSADFGQTVYGGALDWQTGVLTVDRAIFTLTGEDGAKMTGTSGVRPQVFGFDNSLGILKPADGSLVADALSSHFKIVSWTELTSGSMFDAFAIHANGSIGFAYNGTISEANAWLSAQYAAGTPVQVCYKLATPTTIQLTPQEILALAGVNNIWCDAGETTVSGRTDILWLANDTQRKLATVNRNIMVTSTGTFSVGGTIKLNDTLMGRNPVFIDMEYTVASGRVSGADGSKVMSVSVVNSYNSGLAIKYVTFGVSDDGLTLTIKAIRNMTLTSSGIAVSDSSSVSINGVRIITG